MLSSELFRLSQVFDAAFMGLSEALAVVREGFLAVKMMTEEVCHRVFVELDHYD